MTQFVIEGLSYFGLGILFGTGVLILAVGARSWSDATAAAHRARAHGIEADVTERTIQSADEIVAERKRVARAQYTQPSDDEILQSILDARRNGAPTPDEEYTTSGNEGVPPEAEPPAAFYRT